VLPCPIVPHGETDQKVEVPMARLELTQVPGIGAVTAERLRAIGIDDVSALATRPVEDLAALPGFHASRAATVRAAARQLLGAAAEDTAPVAEVVPAAVKAKARKAKASEADKTKKVKKAKTSKESKKSGKASKGDSKKTKKKKKPEKQKTKKKKDAAKAKKTKKSKAKGGKKKKK